MLLQLFLLPHRAYHMMHCGYRVVKHHSWSRKTHHLADFLAHLRLIAVNLTVGAKSLIFHERAVLAPASGIAFQLRTFSAEFLFRAMFFVAVQLYHEGNHLFFLLTLRLDIFFTHLTHPSVLDRVHLIRNPHRRLAV